MIQHNNSIIPLFLEILRSMDNIINETIRNLISNFNILTLIILFFISFLYGILHSIGPGHGKTLIASFFLKEKHPLKKSLLLSGIVSIIHSGSAIILSFLLYFVLTGIKGMFKIKLQSYFMATSGILIIIIGILFLILKIFHKDEINSKSLPKNRNLILIGLSAGIVPCPVALMIMLLTISKNIIFIGLLSVFSISMGMFFLLTIIGLISIKSRDGIIFVSGKITKNNEIISTVIEYMSIIFIILIGIGMSLNIILSLVR